MMNTENLHTPLVSVIIPVYNQTEYLVRAVNSAMKQTYKNIEIIVVDDGSEIDIKEVLDTLEDERIKFYRYTEHRNANVARNRGIDNSQGKYIAMLDSDDEWLAEHIEECMTTLERENSDGIYGSLIIAKSDRNNIIKARALQKGETMINYLLKMGFGAQTSTLFFTAESIKKVRWDESLSRHQDYDFLVRYHKEYKLFPKEQPTVKYHYTPKNYELDFNSCIRFIESNRKDIAPELYHRYQRGMFNLVKSKKKEKSLIQYYQREAVRYKKYITYQDYLEIMQPIHFFNRIKCKWNFIIGLF